LGRLPESETQAAPPQPDAKAAKVSLNGFVLVALCLRSGLLRRAAVERSSSHRTQRLHSMRRSDALPVCQVNDPDAHKLSLATILINPARPLPALKALNGLTLARRQQRRHRRLNRHDGVALLYEHVINAANSCRARLFQRERLLSEAAEVQIPNVRLRVATPL
jgi:hypothetical protein